MKRLIITAIISILTAIFITSFLSLSYGASIAVVSPNGGETWQTGNSYTIQWTSSGVTGNVKIILRKGGVKVKTLHPSAGAPNTGSFPWTITNDITPGSDYRIRVKNMDGSVKDDSNGDFTIAQLPGVIIERPVRRPLFVPMPPDLQVYFNYTPTILSQAFESTFNFIVQNAGGAGSQPCILHVSILSKDSGEFVVQRDLNIPAIKKGAQHTVSLKHHFSKAGKYIIATSVDHNNQVRESKEDNNFITQNLTVQEIKPDIIISDLATMQKYRVGRKATVWGKVKNIGDIPSFKVKMVCSPNKTRIFNIPGLPKNAEGNFEGHFKWWSKGTKRCKVIADSANEVDEKNENNNEAKISTKIYIL